MKIENLKAKDSYVLSSFLGSLGVAASMNGFILQVKVEMVGMVS